MRSDRRSNEALGASGLAASGAGAAGGAIGVAVADGRHSDGQANGQMAGLARYAVAVPVIATCWIPGVCNPAMASAGSIPAKMPDGLVNTNSEKM
jgi:hypothetical protein